MSGAIEARLRELGVALPKAAAPAANYVPWTRAGDLVFVAGQIPILDGAVAFTGRVGEGLTVEDGYQAARLCALNLIAHLRTACDGDLDRVRQVVRLGGFVSCVPDFTEHPKVVNGASDLMVDVFGDIGRHARAAVGAPSLPLGAAVEVDGVFLVL